MYDALLTYNFTVIRFYCTMGTDNTFAKRNFKQKNIEFISSHIDTTMVYNRSKYFEYTTVNRVMYVLVTLLCTMMICWILIFPSSLWYEHSPIHQRILHKALNGSGTIGNKYSHGSVSSDLITKYQGQYMVQMTHILPGAIWAVLVPFQLNTPFRKKYPFLHRYLGYTFTSVALLVGIGVFIILHRGLFYENFFDDLAPKMISTSHFMMFMATYFIGTILTSVYYVAVAKRRSFDKHSIWITRHIASGIWIALQRILLGSPIFNRPPMTREQQRDAFGNAGFLAIAISTITSEMLIVCWSYYQPTSKEIRKVD